MSHESEHNSQLELVEQAMTNSLSENGQQTVYQQLKPTDGGQHAWRMLIAAFFVEALLWGFPMCFGVFQEYYSHIPSLANSNVALIGTIAQGLGYLGAPVFMALTKRFPKYQHMSIWVGWALCIIAMGTGSLTTNLGGLVATQGLLYALGFLTMYWPIMSMVNEWWVARKGFAFGFIMSAAGISGAILPFIFQALLQKYGYKITLRATAIAMIILTGPLIPFCKGRLPASESSTIANMDWTFRSDIRFWAFLLGTIVQGFGLFFPGVFLASYATDIGLSSNIGALLLSMLALSQFVGQCAFGYISDKSVAPVGVLAMTCAAIASIAAFTLWGFGHSTWMLLLFSVTFGFFGYGYTSMRSAMAKQLTNDPMTLIALQSILNGALGFGNVLVGPISAKLIHGSVQRQSYAISKYEDLAYFTGSCMLGSGVLLMVPYVKNLWLHKIGQQ